MWLCLIYLVLNWLYSSIPQGSIIKLLSIEIDFKDIFLYNMYNLNSMTKPGHAERIRQQQPPIDEQERIGSSAPFDPSETYDAGLPETPSIGHVAVAKVFSAEILTNRELELYREENHDLSPRDFDFTMDILKSAGWNHDETPVAKNGAVMQVFTRNNTTHDRRLDLRGVILDPKLKAGEKTGVAARFHSGSECEGQKDVLRVYSGSTDAQTLLSVIAIEKRIRRLKEVEYEFSKIDELTEDERKIVENLWLPRNVIADKYGITETQVTRHMRQAAHRLQLQSPEDVAILGTQHGVIQADIPKGRTRGLAKSKAIVLSNFPGISVAETAKQSPLSEIQVACAWEEIADRTEVDSNTGRMQIVIMAAADGNTKPNYIPEAEI